MFSAFSNIFSQFFSIQAFQQAGAIFLSIGTSIGNHKAAWIGLGMLLYLLYCTPTTFSYYMSYILAFPMTMTGLKFNKGTLALALLLEVLMCMASENIAYIVFDFICITIVGIVYNCTTSSN